MVLAQKQECLARFRRRVHASATRVLRRSNAGPTRVLCGSYAGPPRSGSSIHRSYAVLHGSYRRSNWSYAGPMRVLCGSQRAAPICRLEVPAKRN